MSPEAQQLPIHTVERYLDEREKLQALEEWFSVLTDLEWKAADGAGGTGAPDRDMVSWCIRLNRLPGICTIQSCAGHIERGALTPGHVWLRLDRETSAAFDELAYELARLPPIEQVSRIYMADGQEVTAIAYHGNERNSLAVSMELVCSFVEQVVERARSTTCTYRRLA